MTRRSCCCAWPSSRWRCRHSRSTCWHPCRTEPGHLAPALSWFASWTGCRTRAGHRCLDGADQPEDEQDEQDRSNDPQSKHLVPPCVLRLPANGPPTSHGARGVPTSRSTGPAVMSVVPLDESGWHCSPSGGGPMLKTTRRGPGRGPDVEPGRTRSQTDDRVSPGPRCAKRRGDRSGCIRAVAAFVSPAPFPAQVGRVRSPAPRRWLP